MVEACIKHGRDKKWVYRIGKSEGKEYLGVDGRVILK
jgi:hypothetical protein